MDAEILSFPQKNDRCDYSPVPTDRIKLHANHPAINGPCIFKPNSEIRNRDSGGDCHRERGGHREELKRADRMDDLKRTVNSQ